MIAVVVLSCVVVLLALAVGVLVWLLDGQFRENVILIGVIENLRKEIRKSLVRKEPVGTFTKEKKGLEKALDSL